MFYVAGTIEVCIILYYMFRYVCMSSILVQSKSHAVYSGMFPILVYFWDLHSNVYFWDLHSNAYFWDLHSTEMIFLGALFFFPRCLRLHVNNKLGSSLPLLNTLHMKQEHNINMRNIFVFECVYVFMCAGATAPLRLL